MKPKVKYSKSRVFRCKKKKNRTLSQMLANIFFYTYTDYSHMFIEEFRYSSWHKAKKAFINGMVNEIARDRMDLFETHIARQDADNKKRLMNQHGFNVK